jgi:ferric-dicitrate binding protein FerR (iron transport regulator)
MLDSPVPDSTDRPSAPPDRRHRGPLIAAAIGGLVVLVLAGWIIHLRNNDGTANAPDGRRVTVVGSGTIVAPADAPPAESWK